MAANMIAAYYTKGADSHDAFKGLNIASDPFFEEYINKYNVLKIDCGAFTGKEYYEQYPEHRTPFSREYQREINMFKKYAMNNTIEPKYHDFITKEGLRFALYTDFS